MSRSILTATEIQDRLRQHLTFKHLKSAQQCDGSKCILQKVDHHHEMQHRSQYHSFLLHQMVSRMPVQRIARGYLLIHLQPQQCWVCYADIGETEDPHPTPDEATTTEAHHIMIQTEVVVCGREEVCNYLVILSPDGALAIAICSHDEVFHTVPWDLILQKLPQPVRGRGRKRNSDAPQENSPSQESRAGTKQKKDANDNTSASSRSSSSSSGDSSTTTTSSRAGPGLPRPKKSSRITLLNPKESDKNPMRYLLWAHSAMTFVEDRSELSIIHTLMDLKKREDGSRSDGRKGQGGSEGQGVIVGAYMYELHVLDSFVPKRIDDLQKEMEAYTEKRTRLVEQTKDDWLFTLPKQKGRSPGEETEYRWP